MNLSTALSTLALVIAAIAMTAALIDQKPRFETVSVGAAGFAVVDRRTGVTTWHMTKDALQTKTETAPTKSKNPLLGIPSADMSKIPE